MNNQLCSMCHAEDASCFCYCNGEDALLCEAHYQAHTQKKSGTVHLKYPLAALSDHKLPGYLDRLNARLLSVERGKTELFKSLEVVDTCLSELSTKEIEILNTLTEYFEDKIMQLHEVKTGLERDINEAIEEVESTKYQDRPVLHGKLSELLRNFGQGRNSLKVFNYVIDKNPYPPNLDSILQFNQGANSEEIKFLTVTSSLKQELEDKVSKLQVSNRALAEATQKNAVLEARLRNWRIVSDPPVESQVPVPDTRTPRSEAALQKFGPDPDKDDELVLLRRGPVVLAEGVYTGQWSSRDQRHGYGKMILNNGDVREGQWRNGNLTGKGRSVLADGTVYIGEFVRGIQEGMGTKYCTNGDEYSGTWVNGKLHGICAVKFKESNELRVGEYKEGDLMGRGANFWDNGTMYVGSWKAGKQHGNGAFIWPDGQMYIGRYENDMRSGMGCFVYSNGDVYRGGWKEGKQFGQGRLTNPGTVKEGVWDKGVLQR